MGRLRASSMSSFAASSVTKAGVSKGGGAGYGDADVAKLKDAIQMLCQSTHPLGQYDFVFTNVCVWRESVSKATKRILITTLAVYIPLNVGDVSIRNRNNEYAPSPPIHKLRQMSRLCARGSSPHVPRDGSMEGTPKGQGQRRRTSLYYYLFDVLTLNKTFRASIRDGV